MASQTPYLVVDNLTTQFLTPAGTVRAVRGISFHVCRGETVGIVGESGSGKSVTALSLMRLVVEPGRITQGRVMLDGHDVLTMTARELRGVRGGRMAMVFQDPFASLNPTMTIGEQIAETVRAHAPITRQQARERTLELLQSVQIPSPEVRVRQYPHELSGGQRQRVMIAIAFAGEPSLIIADEPTTALDVTVQAQIMALVQDYRQRANAAVLMITHDLGLVAQTCDRVLVMYAGQIVEEGSVTQVLGAPHHPYTIGLLESLPRLTGDRSSRLPSIPGQPPDLANLPDGCPFAARCAKAMPVCGQTEPTAHKFDGGQMARCHLYTNQANNL